MKQMMMAVLAAALVAGCGVAADGVMDSDPTALGSVTSVSVADGVVSLGFAPDVGYEYYEGTTFRIGDDVAVRGDLDGTVVGDRIQVWTGECAESFPVQCRVEAIEVGHG